MFVLFQKRLVLSSIKVVPSENGMLPDVNAGAPDIVMSPEPNKELPFMVLMVVPLTNIGWYVDDALYSTNAVSSVAIGSLTGGALSGTQTGVTFIGYGATSSLGGLTNATAIGYMAMVGASNSLVLGGTGSYAVNVGIGLTTPTSRLHLPAGTSSAGTAPIKLTAGTNLTTPENGAFEFDGTNLYFTVGGVRKTVTLVWDII